MRIPNRHLGDSWPTVSLGTLVERITVGLAISVTEHYRPSGVTLIRNQNIGSGTFLSDDMVTISEEFAAANVQKAVRTRDVITVRTGSNIGQTCVVPNQYSGSQTFTTLITTTDQTKLLPEYLSLHVNSEFGIAEVNRLQVGGGKGNLNAGHFEGYQLVLPPLAEQKAIAGVLSAWDRAIEQTTALIAAKQRLKQGLMQQLFGEAAHSVRQLESTLCHLGDVASETIRRNSGGLGTGFVYSVTKANGMIPMPVDTIGNDIARYKLVRPKAFAYNPMRINIGSIARWEGDDDVLVSPDYVVFECGPELDPDYLNHFRRGHVWDSYVKRSGDGSVRVRIYFDHLSRMRIRLPGVQEQRRIAKVLNAATSELTLLEKKLNFLKQQKRGLMQQLLTGNTRLPTKPRKVKDE